MLAGANLSSARLDKADLTGGVQAQGANFLNASLQGADLTGAQLQFADFSSAAMQGSLLNFAQLQGAILRDADLGAASLLRAKLQGADMTGMRMAGTDLRGAAIWRTLPPQWDASGLTDLSDFTIRPLDEAEQTTLQRTLGSIGDGDARCACDGGPGAAPRHQGQLGRQLRPAALAELGRASPRRRPRPTTSSS